MTDKQPAWKRATVLAWAGPTTLLGMGLALFGGPRARWRRRNGVVEVVGGRLPTLLRMVPVRGGAAALALGHVILAQDERILDLHRRHELVHVRQAERWGPLFVPAYLLAGGWQLVRGRHPYRDNPFEIAARSTG